MDVDDFLAQVTKTQEACPHANFNAQVDVNRMEDTGAFMSDIRISCRDCGLPFQFVGVDTGVDFYHPMKSFSGEEMHAPIVPKGKEMPRGLTGFRVRRSV